jgi:hypothetical protein
MIQTAESAVNIDEINRALFCDINGDRATQRLPVYANLTLDQILAHMFYHAFAVFLHVCWTHTKAAFFAASVAPVVPNDQVHTCVVIVV